MVFLLLFVHLFGSKSSHYHYALLYHIIPSLSPTLSAHTLFPILLVTLTPKQNCYASVIKCSNAIFLTPPPNAIKPLTSFLKGTKLNFNIPSTLQMYHINPSPIKVALINRPEKNECINENPTSLLSHEF